ncbi:hypothetical protein PCN81_07390 [Streptococcus suis]|nr:hypothetical protein [Streptococcus suis]MDN2998395.1 hypothetical protein [Streptococcus suis]
MKALIFDVDDTLYDQIQPFERALERHIEVAREQIEPLYLSFRRLRMKYLKRQQLER